MTLTTDATRINELFAEGHRLVFWFDPTADRAGEINGISINGKLLKLTGSNYLRTKVLLEHEDRESNYLVYAAFARPEEETFPLADTVRYAATYFSDRISEVMKRKDLPAHSREYLEAYPQFWRNSQRMERFIQLDLPQHSQQTMDIAVLAALSSSKVVNFDEITHKVLGVGLDKGGEMLQAFAAQGALDAFWQLCSNIYGYAEEEPSLEGLVATMLCTYTQGTGVSLPQRLQRYISPKCTNITVFVQHFMGHKHTSAAFDAFSLEYMARLNLKDVLIGKRTEELLPLDAFALVDEIILERMTRALVEGEPHRPVAGLPMEEVAARRMQKNLHFAADFEARYRMVLDAKELMLLVSQPQQHDSAVDMTRAYMKTMCRADSCYRKFYLAYDRLSVKTAYEQLSQHVEKAYVNDWLDQWNQQFSGLLREGRRSLGLPLQEQFAAQRITPRAGRERTVVIISDALRYEVAKELAGKLNAQPRYDAELSAMVGVLPSITSLGMAALLPHEHILVQEGRLENPLVDGKPSTGTANRQKILTAHYPHAVAMTVKDVMELASTDFADKFNGKDVIYIYHDQIDVIGDEQVTQNQVFEACEQAMEEIEAVIRRLTNEISATSYFVTADHGFQYRRSQIQEYEKVETRGTNPLFPGRRHRVTREPEDMAGTISFPFPNIEGGAWVHVPVAAGIFKQQGGGQNFVHGGASMAEMLVPLMTVKSRKGRQATRKAGLKLLQPSDRRVNNLRIILEFLQEEPISPMVTPVTYEVSFQTSAGLMLSGVELVQANIEAAATTERIIKTRITLQSRRYDPRVDYYLVIKNSQDALDPGERIPFNIDIAFANDFGLGSRR